MATESLNLNRVTVIIPAHNRPERLRRLLEYYGNCGVKLLVPDSSTLAFPHAHLFPDVTYIHRPGLHFLLKIQEVIPMISTPYVLYVADDDFTVPEAIAQMADFLDSHPSHVCAQGHYLTFTPHANGKIDFFPRYIRHFDKCVEHDSARQRLTNEVAMYASLLYGVIRTSTFSHMYRYCFDASGSLRFRNLFLAEEFFNHAALILGKYATLPVFYSARERIAGSATDTTVPASVIKTAPEYAAEFQGYVTALSLLLNDTEVAAGAASNIEDASAFMHNICMRGCAADSRSVVIKRAIVMWASRHRATAWLTNIMNRRYAQKGLKAVAGMDSYPCTTATPQRLAIEHAVRSTL